MAQSIRGCLFRADHNQQQHPVTLWTGGQVAAQRQVSAAAGSRRLHVVMKGNAVSGDGDIALRIHG